MSSSLPDLKSNRLRVVFREIIIGSRTPAKLRVDLACLHLLDTKLIQGEIVKETVAREVDIRSLGIGVGVEAEADRPNLQVELLTMRGLTRKGEGIEIEIGGGVSPIEELNATGKGIREIGASMKHGERQTDSRLGEERKAKEIRHDRHKVRVNLKIRLVVLLSSDRKGVMQAVSEVVDIEEDEFLMYKSM